MPNIGKGTKYNRHDRVGVELHFNTSKEIGVKLENKHWYDHVTSGKTSHDVKVTIP
jgi:hypothetical protein